MGSELVIRRIHAWQDAGLIDAATASRLEEAEGTEPAVEEPARSAGALVAGPREAPITIPELFAYLGGAFLLAAWYALAASTTPYALEDAWYGAAALVVTVVLCAAAGWLRRRADRRSRRAAGVALLVMLPNLGVAVNNLVGVASGGPTDAGTMIPFAAALAVVLAALASRRFVPALSTQTGLALACVAAGAYGLAWLESVLFPSRWSDWGEYIVDPTADLARTAGTIAWWLLVGTVMAVLLVRLDRGDGVVGRRRLGRLAAGLTVVGGTATAVMATGYMGEPVLEPFVGAGILALEGIVLVGLAGRLGAAEYVWPGGLAIFGALTYLNAQYLAVETGLWVGLLVEGILLLVIGFVTRQVAERIQKTGEPQAAA
jgi:hypothetical protein